MTGFSPATRQIIIDRAGGVCERCAAGPIEQLHHRRARGAGGSKRADTNTPANALAVCSPCHAWIESNRIKALEMGWLVRQGLDPEQVPVMYRGMGLVNLHANGQITPYPEDE